MLDTREISAADQQQLGAALAGNASVNAPLPFAAGLYAQESYGCFRWRDLPGAHSLSMFRASNWFAQATTTEAGSFSGATYGSGHNGEIAFANGSTGYRNGSSVALGGAATGAHAGLLGSIFTTGTSLVIASDTEATKTFTPAGLGGITKPCEINGFVFFTACVTNATEVIGYLPPPYILPDSTFGNTEALQRRVQHFSTEHIGIGARVGMFQGQIVVATNRGVWGIEPIKMERGYGIGDGYALGPQMEGWDLGGGAQFAITHDNIWALDSGVLLRKGSRDAELIGNCGFSVLSGDGRAAILSESGGRFAVSNGSDFEEYGGAQRASVVGTLLGYGGDVFTLQRAAWSGVDTVTLTTAWAKFPNSIALEAVFVDPGVKSVTVATESGTFDLMRSGVAPAMWRSGYGGTRIKLMIEVPTGLGIAPPVLKLRRRTQA